MCSDDSWDLVTALHSRDLVERYAAIKAAGATEHRELVGILSDIGGTSLEDWRIRLEAQVALARLEPTPWIGQIMSRSTNLKPKLISRWKRFSQSLSSHLMPLPRPLLR